MPKKTESESTAPGGREGFYGSGNGGESGSEGVVPWREDQETASAAAAALVLLWERGGRGDEGFIDGTKYFTSASPFRGPSVAADQKKAWPIIFFPQKRI
jgi:hypothetical protein